MSRLRDKLKQRIPAVVLFVVLLALWQFAANKVNIQHILPGPLEIIRKTWEIRESLLTRQLPETMKTAIIGWCLSIITGVIVAILMDVSHVIESLLYPVLIVTQTVPVMCITPLFVLWFGYTIQARLLAVVLSTFFGIALNVFNGLRSFDKEKYNLMKTYGASSQSVYFHLKVPYAFPKFVTALKMTLPWAVVGAAVSEWLGATQGLGYYSRRMVANLDGPGVFAPVLILCIVSLIMMSILKVLEKRFVKYRNEI